MTLIIELIISLYRKRATFTCYLMHIQYLIRINNNNFYFDNWWRLGVYLFFAKMLTFISKINFIFISYRL